MLYKHVVGIKNDIKWYKLLTSNTNGRTISIELTKGTFSDEKTNMNWIISSIASIPLPRGMITSASILIVTLLESDRMIVTDIFEKLNKIKIKKRQR